MTPDGATQAVTQTVRQCQRWTLSHCQWGVLVWGSHKEARWREQVVSRLVKEERLLSQLSSL